MQQTCQTTIQAKKMQATEATLIRAIKTVLTAILLLIPVLAQGYSGGITGQSTAGCTLAGCHGDSPGSYNYTGTLQGFSGGIWTATPTAVTPGGSLSVRFLLSYVSGTVATLGGFNMSATSGALSESDATIQESGGELTHTTPRSLTFANLSWTAPATIGIYSNVIRACGQPVNNNGNNTGDGPHRCDSMTLTVNSAPSATNDSPSVSEDSSNNCISVLSNDTSGSSGNETGDSLTLFSVGATNNGGTAVVSGGSCSASQMRYTPAANFSGTETFTYTIRDSFNSASYQDTATVSVTVNNTNDAPAITAVDNALNYTENQPAQNVDSTITLSDIDSSNLNRAEINISTNCALGEDVLEVSNTSCTANSLTCTQTDNCTLTITGTRPLLAYEAILEAITYRNTSNSPDANTRTVQYRVRDDSNSYSSYDSTTITIISSSDAPTVTTTGGSLSYIENQPAQTIDNGVTLADLDSTQLNLAEIEISTNCASGEDRLEINNSVCTGQGLTCTVINNCSLTASGTQPLSNYQTVLRAMTYRNTSEAPNTSTRTVRLRIRDSGNTYSTYSTRTVTVEATNDTPVASNDSFNIAVNSTSNSLVVLSNDSDIDGDTLSISNVSTPSNGGNVVIGTPCIINTLCYTPAPNFTGVETFTYTTSDSNGGSSTATVTTSPNDADSDGVIDFSDNCPNIANADQANADQDSEGDVCDSDDNNDGNFESYITLNISQGTASGSFILQDSGIVTITAGLTDPLLTGLSYDWSATTPALYAALTINNGQATLNPATLPTATYVLDIRISDGVLSVHTQQLITLRAGLTDPLLFDCNNDNLINASDSNDCDNDGDDNTTEGYQDSDADNTPDYLDSNLLTANQMHNQILNASTQYVLTAETGLFIRLGHTARFAGKTGALLSESEIAAHGAADGASVSNATDSYRHFGGIYDFEITGLAKTGDTASIVIPLLSNMRSGAVYRKYTPAAGWHTFTRDANNSVKSAKGLGGICPAPGSQVYGNPQVFHDCIQLTLQDGGPNDADGEANGIIRDPGGFATDPSITPTEPEPAPSGLGGGSATDPVYLILLLLAWLYLARIRRQSPTTQEQKNP